jgi:uncharacterized protein (DUF433 family)
VAKVRFDPTKKYVDTREMPIYGIPLAAHYLRLPYGTLAYWVLGRRYDTDHGRKTAVPVITRPDETRPLLSFFNLVEAHVLRALRKEHGIKLNHIRRALDFLTEKFGKAHPLIQHQFRTDGARLFVEQLGKLIDVTGFGQTVMPELMIHLERLEFEDDVVARLYPFTRPRHAGPRSVFIDPRYSFGRPVLADIKVPTGVIADRYAAGESIKDLAIDYGCTALEIEEAIRCELQIKQAA